jgi:hypothetical protein
LHRCLVGRSPPDSRDRGAGATAAGGPRG